MQREGFLGKGRPSRHRLKMKYNKNKSDRLIDYKDRAILD